VAKLEWHKIDRHTLIEAAATDENASAAWRECQEIEDAGGIVEVYYEPRIKRYDVKCILKPKREK